jgi:serine/threonine protein kinase
LNGCIEEAGAFHTMNETLTLIDETVPEVDLQWQQRLDELVSGECSEDAFMDHVLNMREAGPYTAWNVVALLDQRYRRGQLPAEVFRSIESKIAQYELADIDYGMTIDLLPAIPDPNPADPNSHPPGPNSHAAGPGSHAAGASAVETPGGQEGFTATRAQVDRPAAALPEVGSKLRHRYVIERRLGTGGMGTVFKALDHYRCDLPEGDRHVAMKFLHPRINGRPEILSDLRREFYCAQALAHPNIVKVYELDQDEDFVFFTMEFLEGELLSGVIERLNPRKISRSSAWTLIQAIGAGLAHAHSRNVVHADLKPHNIMITSLGEVRILDFGAASSPARYRPNADANQKSNSRALTPAYASCELLESKPADARDDLYALACVSYELLAGEHPFQRRRSTEARDLGLVARRLEGLTRAQWNTLAQGLSWRREERSISVADWLAQLSPPADTATRLAVPLGLTAAAEAPRLTPALKSIATLTPISPPATKSTPALTPAPMPPSTPAPKSTPVTTLTPILAPTPISALTPIPAPMPISAPALASIPARAPAPRPAPRSASVPKSTSAPRLVSAANSTSTALRIVAALALVVLGFGLWLSLSRRSIDSVPVPNATAPEPSANSPISPDVFAPQAPSSQPLSSGPPLPAGVHASANDSSMRVAPAQGAQTPAVPQTAKPDAADPATRKAKINAINLSAGVYRVRSRQNFAELHVHRTPGSPGSASFVWWTEPGSAAAGVDYVAQARVPQLLPAGTRAASLFIRLLPNASRKHSAMFYVLIGEAGDGATLGRVARTTVILPAS